MRPLAKFVACSLLAAGCAHASATTWFDKTVPDPIDATKTCAVKDVASYGSYIYQWPSKYDMVFWPFIADEGLWYCQDTGFIAFINDFRNIPEDERAAIAALLKDRKKPTDARGRLEQLEAVYALRHKDVDAHDQMLRTLARRYQQLGDVERANGYRKAALAEMTARLDTPLGDVQKMQYLYLAANYSRVLGDAAASDAWLAKLNTTLAGISDDKLKDMAGYVQKLSAETPKIQPGGALEPH